MIDIIAAEILVALVIAVPLALVATGVLMQVAERANRFARRWDRYCLGKQDYREEERADALSSLISPG